MTVRITSVTIYAIIASTALSAGGEDTRERDDRARVWQTYAVEKYSNMNARLNGALSPVFTALGDVGALYQYFDDERQSDKFRAYSEFLVQALGDAMHGDVGEAMFAEVLIETMPPDVLLRMIVPEIGPHGRLEGILDGEHSRVAKRIERRGQVAYAGNVNFDGYVSYLKGRKDRGFHSQTNADVIVEHMFRTEPQRAFTSMLWADFGFLPYARGNCYLYCGKETEEVRRLQQTAADISAFQFRYQYSFPIADDEEDKVEKLVGQLGRHERAWVRLFVVCLAEKERNLRFSAVIDPLADDPDERVRNAVARIKKEYPPWQEKTKKAK